MGTKPERIENQNQLGAEDAREKVRRLDEATEKKQQTKKLTDFQEGLWKKKGILIAAFDSKSS